MLSQNFDRYTAKTAQGGRSGSPFVVCFVAAAPGWMVLCKAGWLGLGGDKFLSSAESNHPVLHKVVHPYYVVLGWVCERLNRLVRTGHRRLRFGVGAGVCLGRSAARDVTCVWAPWGVLGEGWIQAWGEGIGGVASGVWLGVGVKKKI